MKKNGNFLMIEIVKFFENFDFGTDIVIFAVYKH